MRDTGMNFYDAQGNFVGLGAAQNILKNKFGGVGGDRLKMLESIFGEGATAAEGLIKADSISEINAQNERNLKLMQKVKNLNDGLTASYDEMVQAMKNAGGSVFAPITGHLSALSRGGRNIFEGISNFSENHPGMSKGGAYLGGALLAGTAAYGLYNMGKALLNFKSLAGGLAGIGMGVAAGKALEKTAGIMPVFVTNMPGGGSSTFTTGAGMVLGGTAAGGLGAAAATTGASLVAPVLAVLAILGVSAYAGVKTGEWIKNRSIDFDKMEGSGQMRLTEKSTPKININLNVDKSGRVTAGTDLGTDLQISTGGLRGAF
jgi:hypothetical protein